MSLKLARWLLPSFVAILLAFVLVVPVLAIDEPNSLSINGVWVYRNCKETDDQLYIVSYSINYTSNPTESVTDAYLCRLMDGAVELRAVAPFAYYDDGYGDGVVSIYFDADDAPTWDGGYTMQLAGNPFLVWNASAPLDTYTPFDLWQDNEKGITQQLVAGRVIDLAGDLETSWGKDMVTVDYDGNQVLTTYALAYFLNVIPYLGDIAPSVFPEGEGMIIDTVPPEVPPDESGSDYADELETNILGTPFDFTNLADDWGVERGPLTAFIYYGIVAFVLILFARRIGSYKPVMALAIPFVILGNFVGVPLLTTALIGIVALFLTAWVMFYKPSNA